MQADNKEEEYGDLSEECDISVECKVCHNVYKSLDTFISHKKKDCRVRMRLYI